MSTVVTAVPNQVIGNENYVMPINLFITNILFHATVFSCSINLLQCTKWDLSSSHLSWSIILVAKENKTKQTVKPKHKGDNSCMHETFCYCDWEIKITLKIKQLPKIKQQNITWWLHCWCVCLIHLGFMTP